MSLSFLSVALLFNQLQLPPSGTYQQRCLSGLDLENTIAWVESHVVTLTPVRSYRVRAQFEQTQTKMTYEYFFDKRCSSPYLTNEVVYENTGDGTARLMENKFICQSQDAKFNYDAWAEHLGKTAEPGSDGMVYVVSADSLPEDARRYRILALPNGNSGGLIVRAHRANKFPPLEEVARNEAFKPVR